MRWSKRLFCIVDLGLTCVSSSKVAWHSVSLCLTWPCHVLQTTGRGGSHFFAECDSESHDLTYDTMCLHLWPNFVFVYRLQEEEGIISDGPGNYTEDNKCMWLVDTGLNESLWFQFYQFSTECGWDHLYIYDGDSAFSPLLAAFR